jgi:hypothetical protein
MSGGKITGNVGVIGGKVQSQWRGGGEQSDHQCRKLHARQCDGWRQFGNPGNSAQYREQFRCASTVLRNMISDNNGTSVRIASATP